MSNFFDSQMQPPDDKPPTNREVECKYCGKSGLQWVEGECEGEWELINEHEEVHNCDTTVDLNKLL